MSRGGAGRNRVVDLSLVPREFFIDPMRLDQWLWAVRIYKTRTSAADAIKGGLVKVGDEPVKPAREAKPGDLITARVNQMMRTVMVLDAQGALMASFRGWQRY